LRVRLFYAAKGCPVPKQIAASYSGSEYLSSCQNMRLTVRRNGGCAGTLRKIFFLREEAVTCSRAPNRFRYFLVLAALLAVSPLLGYQNPDALKDAQRWVSAKFLGKVILPPARGYLMVHNASGSIIRNEIQGHPLRIGPEAYLRGLHFSSVGDVEVHLPGPGKSFDSVVGVDSNDLGYYSNKGRAA
jgi:hypothetical protein